MADPATLALLAKGIESVAYFAFDAFTTSPSEKLIAEQQEINAQNRLRASGVFSDSEVATIMREYNAQVNTFAGSVAARGLGSSAVGGSLISGAQQAPFFQAQRQAAAQYQEGLRTLGSLIQQNQAIEARQQEALGGITKLGALYFGGKK